MQKIAALIKAVELDAIEGYNGQFMILRVEDGWKAALGYPSLDDPNEDFTIESLPTFSTLENALEYLLITGLNFYTGTELENYDFEIHPQPIVRNQGG